MIMPFGRISGFLNDLARPHVTGAISPRGTAPWPRQNTISKLRLRDRIGRLSQEDMAAVERAIRLQLGL